MRVIRGDIDDAVLRFQLRQGFQFCEVLDSHLPDDAESCGYTARIVWPNPDFRQTPGRARPRGTTGRVPACR